MGFTQLLADFGNFIDIRKRVATTVPGLVLAAALVGLSGAAPIWVTKPFVCGNKVSLERRVLTIGDGPMPNVPQQKQAATELARWRGFFVARQQARWCGTTCAAVDLGPAGKSLEDTLHAGRNTLGQADQAAVAALAALDADHVCGEASPAWDTLVSQLMLFGLLGFVLGVMLDPINKGLFLQVLPDLAGRSSAMARIPAALFVSTRRAPRDGHSLVQTDRRPQFYIGKGVITDAEYQDLIDRYYRYSELTVGLVIPLLAASLVAWSYYASTQRLTLGIGVLAVSAVGAIALARLGVRRHMEFTDAVEDLIDGRLQQLAEQQRQAPIDLIVLQQLVLRAEQLLQ